LVWNGENGLRIEWSNKNNENKINLHDVVMINYTCRVARGEVYDSNSEVGKPIPIKTGIGQLIKGWEIAILQMHVLDEGRIMIPSKLGYGEAGLLGVVPQNADIIVDIEIIDKIEPIELLDGVKVYKYEMKNEGAYPTKNQTITFDYFAFKQGSKPGMYDNSYEKGNPFSFKFENDNVVDGLHIGFSTIKANEKAFIEIPAAVAYGSKGLVDLVPKNTPIVFDVRVESIK
jgi:FKBP-type peptidyl-prolyl cis-trans isomerase